MKQVKKTLPCNCPSCSSPLKVTSLACEACETVVSGSFELPLLARLSAEDLQFVIDFVKSSGSLKVMAQQLGLSYPTVRNLLDDIIQKIEKIEKK
ncbi:MAG TPA: DUF2089 family protein [Chitinophaga sp.]|uniref:DUF2089 family protein n=1 Tax=Chitinophaga sp. TaxID=1869181 RepID=UPI002BB65A18|nr:DUF2089 family protein [Chitinophaga sp.]HVI44003.1 DUF2089 family protein [Chitinophaga sp.]